MISSPILGGTTLSIPSSFHSSSGMTPSLLVADIDDDFIADEMENASLDDVVDVEGFLAFAEGDESRGRVRKCRRPMASASCC